MKKSLLMCALMASVLAACGGGSSTRTPPTVQTPNTYDVRNPTATGTQGIPVLAQPRVVQQAAPVVQPQQYTQPAVQQPAAYNPSQHNHAAVANAGTTAVDDGYVRASTEVFSCSNGNTVTIKHLEADTITIALDSLKGNSILKLVSSSGSEVYRSKTALFGKQTEWQQQSAQANLRFLNANNQLVETRCSLKR